MSGQPQVKPKGKGKGNSNSKNKSKGKAPSPPPEEYKTIFTPLAGKTGETETKIVQIPPSKVMEIVGVIQSIRLISGALIKIYEGQGEATAKIIGKPKEIERAEDLIKEIIAIKDYQKIIRLHHHHHEFFIGDEGTKKIKSVEEKSGASLVMLDDESVEQKGQARLRITGTSKQIDDASELIASITYKIDMATWNGYTNELECEEPEGEKPEDDDLKDDDDLRDEKPQNDDLRNGKCRNEEPEGEHLQNSELKDEKPRNENSNEIPQTDQPKDEKREDDADLSAVKLKSIEPSDEKLRNSQPKIGKPLSEKTKDGEPPLIHNKIILMDQCYLDVIKQGTPQTKILPIQKESHTHLKLLDTKESLGPLDQVRLRITGTEKEILNAEKLIESKVFNAEEKTEETGKKTRGKKFEK